MNGEMPAWMVCDAMLSKMRDEFMSMAVREMHTQIEKRNIAVSGEITRLNEASGESESDAFLLSQIVRGHEDMERRFAEQLEGSGADIARREELQKFLLALRQIVTLYNYSKACEVWLADAEKELKERDPVRILAKTAILDRQIRKELLAYMLTRKERNIGLLSEEEWEVANKASELAD